MQKGLEGRIIAPTPGSHVGSTIHVCGYVPACAGDRRYWVVHRRTRGGEFWPKEPRLTIGTDGSFSTLTFEGGAPGPVVVSLLSVDRKADEAFDRWIDEGHRTGAYPSLDPQAFGILELAAVEVHYDPRNKEHTITASPQVSSPRSRRVFLVHGHDGEAKNAVARFLEQVKLEPVILSEEANQGKTVIEKFEHHANVAYAVVLLTPDDVGASCHAGETQKPRARQNVILELGYFIGKLTRERVCALYKGDIELPSDIHGIVYVPLDAGGGWMLRLAKELRASGIEVDLNLARP